MGCGHLRGQHLIALAEIVAPERRAHQLLLRAGDAAEAHRALGPDQVAMLPAYLDASALAGAVAGLARDRPQRRLLERDGEVDDVAPLPRHRPDVDRGNDARGDDRPAKIVDHRRRQRFAFVEAGDLPQMLGIEQLPPLDDEAAEAAGAVRLDRQDEPRRARGMIDGHVERADVGEGIAAAAELEPKRRLAGRHSGGIDRLVGIDAERLAQRPRVGSRSVDSRQLHFGEAILRPRLGFEHHLRRPRRRLDPRGHRGIIIAVGPQQLAEQHRILARAAVDLGSVCGVVPVRFKRRQ
jgi:hypothetical protein